MPTAAGRTSHTCDFFLPLPSPVALPLTQPAPFAPQAENGIRAYISTIPSQANILYTCALNEFNHSVQRFPSVADYEAARANYLEDIVVREAEVEDAITGNNLRIKDQTLHISTATDAADNVRPCPPEWRVDDVRDLVRLLLIPSPNRSNGSHSAQPVLVRAGPGTGKTWMAKQAVFTLADRLLRGDGAGKDGIRLVPIVVFVQRIIYLLREGNATAASTDRRMSLLERYIASVYSGKKMESWCTMLMQAYDMRALVVLLDGVDEAAGLRDQIENFVHKEIVPSGNRVLVTSRPEGVKLETYSKTFIVMNLCQLTNEQQRRVINIQMQGNIFFDHLLSLGEVRKKLDDAYRKVANNARNDLETMYMPSLWTTVDNKTDVGDGKTFKFNQDERQTEVTGTRIVTLNEGKIVSQTLRELNEELRSDDNAAKMSLLDRVDAVIAAHTLSNEQVLEDAIIENMVDGNGKRQSRHTVAVRLGLLLQKERQAQALEQKEQQAKEAAGRKKRASTGEGGESAAAAKASAAMKPGQPGDGGGGSASKLDAGTGGGKGGTGPSKVDSSFDRLDDMGMTETLWTSVMERTDEVLVVHEHFQDTFRHLVTKVVTEVSRDDEEADIIVRELQFGSLKDPVRIYEKALDPEYNDRFTGQRDADGKPVDSIAEACIPDISRARCSLRTGTQIRELISRLGAGLQLSEEQWEVVRPSKRAEVLAAEEQAATLGEPPAPIAYEVQLMHLVNKFEDLDPTHFRQAIMTLKVTHKGVSFYCEIEAHFHEILKVAQVSTPAEHYNFFRKRLQGTVP
jgi:hypothetical protein